MQVEKTGYNPGMDRTTYPAQIQAAEAKVAAQNGQNSYLASLTARRHRAAYRAPAHTGGNDVAPVYFGH